MRTLCTECMTMVDVKGKIGDEVACPDCSQKFKIKKLPLALIPDDELPPLRRKKDEEEDMGAMVAHAPAVRTNRWLAIVALVLAVGLGGTGFVLSLVNGDTGPAGPQGTQGLVGEKGKDGVPGKDGKDGKDGTSTKPEDVVKLLVGNATFKKDVADLVKASLGAAAPTPAPAPGVLPTCAKCAEDCIAFAKSNGVAGLDDAALAASCGGGCQPPACTP